MGKKAVDNVRCEITYVYEWPRRTETLTENKWKCVFLDNNGQRYIRVNNTNIALSDDNKAIWSNVAALVGKEIVITKQMLDAVGYEYKD